MAKLHATDEAQKVIDAAVQMHGGLGVTKGAKVEELYREIRALRIYEGASEVQRMIIARDLLKEHRRMKTLLPAGWPRPKGYSNGISASGRMIFTAGVVGWDEQEYLPVAHASPASSRRRCKNITRHPGGGWRGPEHIVRLTMLCHQHRCEYLRLARRAWRRSGRRSWVVIIRPWHWLRCASGRTAGQGRDRGDGGGPGMTLRPFRPRPAAAADVLPEFRFDLPALQYPERLNAAAELLKRGKPDDLAIVNAHGRWTYAELDEFSGRIARLLVEEKGLIPGNRVLLRGPNGYTLFAAWLGVLKAGGVVVTTMPLLRPGEIATVIDTAEISHAIVDSRFIGDFRGAMSQTRYVKHLVKYDGDYGKGELETRCSDLKPLSPIDTGRDDPAMIAFTSGTTGVPKGCIQFHRDMLAPCDSFARTHFRMEPGDIVMTSAPIAFTFGLGATVMFPLYFGAAAATIEQPSPPAVLEAIAKHGVTHLATAPTAYKAMLSQPTLADALKSLKCCLSAGEHLPSATWAAWKAHTGIASSTASARPK